MFSIFFALEPDETFHTLLSIFYTVHGDYVITCRWSLKAIRPPSSQYSLLHLSLYEYRFLEVALEAQLCCFRMNRILLTSPRSVLGTLLSSFQALPGSMFSNFNFRNFKCAAASLSAGLVGVGAFWYYYYLNDDSRIPKTKHRGIEILYQEHENFAALRKNWKIVSKS